LTKTSDEIQDLFKIESGRTTENVIYGVWINDIFDHFAVDLVKRIGAVRFCVSADFIYVDISLILRRRVMQIIVDLADILQDIFP